MLLPHCQASQGTGSAVTQYHRYGRQKQRQPCVIRGLGTTNNANPLIVVDGMLRCRHEPHQHERHGKHVHTERRNSPSAVYGSRAANGVILITTKPVKATQNADQSTSTATWQSVKPTNSYEFLADYPRALTLRTTPGNQSRYKAGTSFFLKNGTIDQWMAMGRIRSPALPEYRLVGYHRATDDAEL